MIAANWWGKVKTIVQVAAIFLLIAFDPSPLWLECSSTRGRRSP